MKTMQWVTRDKSEWGDGPWASEPDKMQWEDEATGYPCLIVRNRFGALCGYVGVAPNHPYFGKTDRHNTELSTKMFMEESSKALEKYGGFANIPEGEQDHTDVLEQHPDYEEKLMELNCHGGVTFTGGCHKATKEAWEKWRARMLKDKPSIKQYPYGDAAQEWAENGHLIDDYEAWLEKQEASSICHVIGPGEPEVTWIGFDCSHSGDLSPKMEAWRKVHMADLRAKYEDLEPRDTYKPVPYVQNECRDLARQLKELAS